MELLLGAAFSVDSPPPSQTLFFSQHNGDFMNPIGFGDSQIETDEDHSATSSSSIGVPDDDHVDEDDDAVSSPTLIASLEDSLPGKRGLSSFFSGKSKSFANLSEVPQETANVKEIEKAENPFNKRRRLLLANRRACATKKLAFYSWGNPNSMPSLAVDEDDDGETPVRRPTRTRSLLPPPRPPLPNRDPPPIRASTPLSSQSCTSLSDLQ